MTKTSSGLFVLSGLNKRQDDGGVLSREGSALGGRFKSWVVAVQSCQENIQKVSKLEADISD